MKHSRKYVDSTCNQQRKSRKRKKSFAKQRQEEVIRRTRTSWPFAISPQGNCACFGSAPPSDWPSATCILLSRLASSSSRQICHAVEKRHLPADLYRRTNNAITSESKIRNATGRTISARQGASSESLKAERHET